MDRHVKELTRPTPSTHSSSSSSSGPFFSKLFGRRDLASTRSATSTEVPRVSRPVDSSASGQEPRAASEDALRREVRDDQAWTEERWQTFDLEETLQVLQTARDQPLVGGDTQLLDALRTVSQYLARDEEEPPVVAIEQLYAIVESYVDYPSTRKELPVRIESYKLLAILLRMAPPSSSILDRLCSKQTQSADGAIHPSSVTARSVYHSIVDPGSSSDHTSWLLLLSKLSALKVLTKDGENVEGMDGLVAWVIKTTQIVGKEWTAWCGVAEDFEIGVEPTSPSSQALTVLIDYLSAIITHHLPLFGSSDLTTICKPLLCLLWAGANAERVLNPEASSTLSPSNSVGESPSGRVGSGITSPTGLGLESPIKRVGSIRTRREPIKSHSPQGSRTPRGSITSSMLMSPPQLPQRGPSPVPQGPHIPKWMTLVESLSTLFDMLLTKSHLSPSMLAPILHTMTLILGQAPPDDIDAPPSQLAGVESVIFLIVGKRGGRTGEKALKNILEKPLEFDSTHLEDGWEAVVVRGAVVACRMLLRRTAQMDQNSSSPVGLITLPSLLSSLVAALSTNRFPATEPGFQSKRDQWEQVDAEVLYLLEDHLTRLENGPGGEGAALAGDAWVEGEAVCDLLEGVIERAKSFKHADGASYAFQTATDLAANDGGDLPHSLATFSSILLRLPSALARLHASTSAQPSFVHPRYIEMLLNLSRHLPDATAISVIDYYDREGLCLPFTIGWIDNIWKILDAFYIGAGPTKPATAVRLRAAELLYGSVYKYAREMPEHRAQVIDKAILPLLEQTINDEQIASIASSSWNVLITAAVSETIERDEKRRMAIAMKLEAEAELDDDLPELSPAIKEAVAGGSFDRIRDLIKHVAIQSSCKHEAAVPAPSLLVNFGLAQGFAESLAGESDRASSSSKERRTESNAASLMGLVGGFSPTYKTKELPPISTRTMASGPGSHAIVSPDTAEEQLADGKPAPPPASTPPTSIHTECKSLQAIQALIAIFTRLSFAPPHSLTSMSKTARTPASSRCMLLYKDLLNLLYPMADVMPQAAALEDRSASVRIHAMCPRARLVVLQWLVRLRADRKHRIFVASDIDASAMSSAAIIARTQETHDAALAQVAQEEARRRPKTRPAAGTDSPGGEERGRDRSSRESSHRSRSRSRPAAQMVQAPQPVRGSGPYKPLWCIPQELTFERPPDDQPSEGMTTYSPQHPILQHAQPPKDDVWLPVSDYVRVLIGLLSYETDWELISYILVYLPLQLINKHFWCGERAHKELIALMRLICDGITNDRLAKSVVLPSFVKKTDVHAVAYQTLTMMLGYHTFFHNKSDSDDLIQAFDKGLGRNSLTAKPCVHALTIATYEIESSVAKHLPSILGKLSQIMSNVAVSVHILEFLSAVGQTPSLYGNFTEEHYRLVFAVAVTYIQEHNARTDVSFDPASKEPFVLSQHVITLAYYVIYLWFMAVRLPQRAKHVAYITRGLIHANSGKQTIDEMAEVCFDWMARYTYGNADPKPASSFLNELIMRPGDADRPSAQEKKSRSWILGGAIVTITAQARAGWATITTTRPSGTTSMLCKLENVPLLALGEDNADLVSLPAMLMGDRDPEQLAQPVIKAPPLPGSTAPVEPDETPADTNKPANIALSSASQAVSSPLDTESPFGFVWSGATPSQRRKDVSVDPSYLGLQISAYPYASLTSPRGRLIPQDDKFERGLRGIENIAVIDTHKIAVLYAGPGQTTEAEILGNNDGSPWFLRFLSGLGRLIKLKGQRDIFVGGLDRENDEDGEYAYAWWDDLGQMIFHAPILMPKREDDPTSQRKKRLVGNDFVTIVYNNSGEDYKFDTIKTHFQFVNIVISSHTSGVAHAGEVRGDEQGHAGMDFFKVTIQRAPGIPEFSPIGESKLVSAKALPLVVRQIAFHANILAQRFVHIREAQTAQQAEFISNWRARLRAIARIRENMPAPTMPEPGDIVQEQEYLRDFTRNFSERGPNGPKDL